MKYFLLTFFITFFFSCKDSTESDLINHLKGKTWVSKKYKDVLYKSSSVFSAENSSSNDEGLVFCFLSQEPSEFYDSSKKILGTEVKGYNPYWMEENLYVLKNDSTVVDRGGKYLFKVSEIINDILILDFPKQGKKKFVISNNDGLYNNLHKSLEFVNYEWFTGYYELTYNSKKGNIIFNKDGTIDQSEVLSSYKTYDIYGCKGCNENITLIVFSEDHTNLKTLSFIIEKGNRKNNKIVLSQIHETEDADSPIRRNGKKMMLKKVVNTIYSK